MKKINKWLFITMCVLIFSSCSKEADQEVTQEPQKTQEVEAEVQVEESVNSSKSDLINELLNDGWIFDDSIYVATNKSFVVYKRWLDEINTMEFELYIWNFADEPILIEEAVGFVQDFDVSPNEKQIIIHLGESDITNAIVYDIATNTIVTELVSLDSVLWTLDSKGIIGRMVVFTEETSDNRYTESLIYWNQTFSDPIEIMRGKYGIRFKNLHSSETDMIFEVVYPNNESIDLVVSYELLSNNTYPDLYAINPYNYIQSMINSATTVMEGSSYMTDDYAIYWDMSRGALMMWTLEGGEVIIEEDMGAYTDFAISPNQRYIGMTLGTSLARELLVIDSVSQTIAYRNGLVYDSLFWSLDSQYLAFNILNDSIINTNLEIDKSLDVGLLFINDFVGKRIALGTADYYMLVEGFNDIGLDVYEANSEFQKKTGYTILIEDMIESKENYKNIDAVEETFEILDLKFENDYATKRINDGIIELEDFYIREGYEKLLQEGFIPVSSTIDRYNIYDGFISLFFTYNYRNDEEVETKLYDSLTYHTKDGVLINFDLMFKAEETENVFSQMLKDKVASSDEVLIKEFEGFTNEAKFYFVEEGIIVYYREGLYTTKGYGPLYVKLLWEDLKGVVETDSLVY